MDIYVYILIDENGKYYTGITNDIERRLKEHNRGQHRTTKHSKKWELVYQQKFGSRKEAREFEKYCKSGFFRDKRKYFVNHRGVEQPGSSSGS